MFHYLPARLGNTSPLYESACFTPTLTDAQGGVWCVGFSETLLFLTAYLPNLPNSVLK